MQQAEVLPNILNITLKLKNAVFLKKVFRKFKKTIDKSSWGLYNSAKYWEGLVMELTKSEMEIMDVMWAEAVPLSRADLLERSDEKSWKDSSVHILLNGLLQKGAIREAGFVKRSKTYGRTFAPTLTREEYFATTIYSHRHKPDMVGLFAALLKRKDITAEQLSQMEALIAQRKK